MLVFILYNVGTLFRFSTFFMPFLHPVVEEPLTLSGAI